jgi:hypothetical protein
MRTRPFGLSVVRPGGLGMSGGAGSRAVVRNRGVRP